jgi:putative spermidine/putrescine transport system substrate-binding protein
MRGIRHMLAVTALLAGLAVVVGCGSDDDDGSSSGASTSTTKTGASGLPDLEGQKGVFVNYGGPTLDSAVKAWIEPFNQETGAEVTTDSPTDSAKLKAMIESGNVQWDLVDIDPGVGAANCGKGGDWFRTLDEMGVDLSKIDEKYVLDKCGVPIITNATALLYNKEKYKDNPPTKVTDFLDTEKFPGRRALFNYYNGSAEALELAAGVAPDDIYPIKWDVVEDAINKLGDDLVLQNDLAQQSEQLSSGNFDMCMCYTGRAAISPGVTTDKVGIVWDHAWVAYDQLYAPKGSEVPELQSAFMKYIATPEAQHAFTEVQPYGPTTAGPLPEIPKDFQVWMPEFNEDETNGVALVDWKYLSQPGVADDANARWTALTSG